MKHLLIVSGAAGSQEIDIKVDGTCQTFDLSQDIKAQDIFDLMSFSKGDTYQFEKGSSGIVASSSFDAFCDLIEQICKKANEMSEGISSQINAEE